MNVVDDRSYKIQEGVYQCSECGLWYKEKEWKEKCEIWCKKYKSCNLEIVKHSVVQ